MNAGVIFYKNTVRFTEVDRWGILTLERGHEHVDTEFDIALVVRHRNTICTVALVLVDWYFIFHTLFISFSIYVAGHVVRKYRSLPDIQMFTIVVTLGSKVATYASRSRPAYSAIV